MMGVVLLSRPEMIYMFDAAFMYALKKYRKDERDISDVHHRDKTIHPYVRHDTYKYKFRHEILMWIQLSSSGLFNLIQCDS